MTFLKNPSLDYYPEVDSFCMRYFPDYNINYFATARVYHDGRVSMISTNPGWAEDHLIVQDLPPAGLCNFNEIDGTQFMIACEHYDKLVGWDEGSYLEAKNNFNIKNPMLIMVKHIDYIDQYMIDIHHEDAIKLYYNKMDHLKGFFNLFKHEFKELLSLTYKHPIHTNKKYVIKREYDQQRKCLSENQQLLYHEKGFARLTNQEYHCLKLLAKGARIKHIAKILDISPRTVETYIQRIKVKTNLISTFDLIECYWKNQITF